MKRIFVLLSVFVLLTACSDDDDNVQHDEEQIVGSWILVDWNIPGYGDPNVCNLESNITFESDGTANSEFYERVDDDCRSNAQSGDWEYHGDGKYTFNVPHIGRQRGDVTFEGNERFTFSLTFGSMTFERL